MDHMINYIRYAALPKYHNECIRRLPIRWLNTYRVVNRSSAIELIIAKIRVTKRLNQLFDFEVTSAQETGYTYLYL